MGLMLGACLSTVFIVCWFLYLRITKHYDHWAKRGVPFKKPVFPFGSMKGLALGKIHMGHAYNEVYKDFPNERFFGVIDFLEPILVIRDPELIKQILVKDFDHFLDRASFATNPKESINNHLFLMVGESWKNMRQKLSPAFSSGKLKNMFLLMLKCGEQLQECLERLTETGPSVNVKEMFSRFTVDIIATCVFGVEINSLLDENSEFNQMAISLLKNNSMYILKLRFLSLFPKLALMLNIQRVHPKAKQLLPALVSDTVNYREKNNIERKDFLDILIKLRQNKSIVDGTEDPSEAEYKTDPGATKAEGMTLDQMVAQAFIFFAAGYETASSTLTFCMFELAHHPTVQNRLRQEIEEVLQSHGGEVTYQALQDMKYMDQVINETLRLYASLSLLHRRCTQRYKVPGSDLILEPGQRVFIPLYAIHHDPLYFPNPDLFDPDRFTPEEVQKRHQYVHLPFGAGPRNCIGMRLGLMQTKMGLISCLRGWKVTVDPDTSRHVPLMPASFVTQPDRPMNLHVTKI